MSKSRGRRRKNIINHETLSPLIHVKDISFDDAIRLFIQDMEIRNLSNNSIKWYRNRLKKFMEVLPDDVKVPDDIRPEHIKNFILTYRQTENWADSTVNGGLRAVRTFLNYCYNEGLIKQDIGGTIKLIKEKQKVIETFTREQIKLLLKQPDLKTFVGLRDLTILMLMIETGIRISELVGIGLYDVNWREGLILVDGKGNKQRQVPIQLTMIQQLQKYVNIRGDLDTKALFVTLYNKPVSIRHIQDQIKDYGQRAKIENVRISPHTFRHTFAKFYIQNGGDVFTLQKILGHTTLTMVRKYVNFFDLEVKQAHKKFSPIETLFG